MTTWLEQIAVPQGDWALRTREPLREALLADGTAALLWPLLDNDVRAMQHGFARLSTASRRSRFLRDVTELSSAELRYLSHSVDGVNHLAVVVSLYTAEGDVAPVAVGRLCRYPSAPEVADVAVTVLDAWQGRGIGRLLLKDVLSRRPQDVIRLRTVVGADNTASLRLLEGAGRVTVFPEGDDVLTVQVDDLPPLD